MTRTFFQLLPRRAGHGSRSLFLHATCLGLLLSAISPASPLWAYPEPENFLYRVDVRPHAGFTRLAFKLERTPDYSLAFLPGRIRVTFNGTDSTLRKRLRAYSDPNIGGCSVVKRNGGVVVTVAVKDDARGVRSIAPAESNVLVLDVGPAFKPKNRAFLPEGRERLRSGLEQLVTRFDPPLKSEIPFVPTDRRELLKIAPPEDVEQMLAGEAALYRAKGLEAEEALTPIARKNSPLRALALYRLGEAKYDLQKYGEALQAFREGERLWPQFLSHSPATAFSYADSIVRSGDLNSGRKLLGKLIASLAEKKYAPVLLVRLADILSRQGREMEAVAIYRTVAGNFAGNKAVFQARMKLADRRLFSLEPSTYHDLYREYLEITENVGDFSLKEEAFFKAAFLAALYDNADDALSLVTRFEKKFPRGMYATIARGMREELLVPVYRGLAKTGDRAALTKLAADNKEYLAKCLAEEDFAARLVEAFDAEERPKDEITLFSYIVEKPWGSSQAPFLYKRIIADAEKLGDLPLVEKASSDFVQKFPSHPAAEGIRERLAGFAYQRGDMHGVIARLSLLTTGRTRPESSDSLYYLGKAFESVNNPHDADRAMGLFLAELRQRAVGSELVPDACYVSASSRLQRGDRKGAMEMFRAGAAAAGEGKREQFLYKMAEISRVEGKYDEAVRHLQTLIKEGGDPVWQQMASQALADIELRKKLAGKVVLSK